MAREMPHVDGVEHRYVNANGLRFHVAEAGAASAKPVVLLHGWPQHWYEWRRLIGPLAENHRVICPDLRGLGWSDAPEHDYRKETLASDVLGVLDALGVERTGLAGHDWGGYVGFLLCLREPERFESLLALNILPPFLPISARIVAMQWRFWYQLVLASPLGPRIAAGLGGGGRASVFRWLGTDAWGEEELQAFLGQFREPARARASMRYYRDFQLRELPPMIGGRYRGRRLQVPARIVFGTEDKVMDYRVLDGVERLGDELAVDLVHGVGHFIVDERPELVEEHARELFG